MRYNARKTTKSRTLNLELKRSLLKSPYRMREREADAEVPGLCPVRIVEYGMEEVMWN